MKNVLQTSQYQHNQLGIDLTDNLQCDFLLIA